MSRTPRKDGRFMFAHADIVFADRKHRNKLLRIRARRQDVAARALAFLGASR